MSSWLETKSCLFGMTVEESAPRTIIYVAQGSRLGHMESSHSRLANGSISCTGERTSCSLVSAEEFPVMERWLYKS